MREKRFLLVESMFSSGGTGQFPVIVYDSPSWDDELTGVLSPHSLRRHNLGVRDDLTDKVHPSYWIQYQKDTWPRTHKYGLLSPQGVFYTAPMCLHVLVARLVFAWGLETRPTDSLRDLEDHLIYSLKWLHRNEFGWTAWGTGHCSQAQRDWIANNDLECYYQLPYEE